MLLVMGPFGGILDLLANAQHWLVAAIGIGLVVFVHELGHFIVAKRCGVRVEIFSLGFGPRLFGWFRGDTDYRVSLVPIGGYVKMAGDNPGEDLEGSDEELPSKSVAQRFAIFSAGVAMNLVFALLVLPLVLTLGVQFNSTIIGRVTPGFPAWEAGLLDGDEIVAVNGNPVYDFNNIVAEVAVGDEAGVEFKIRRKGPDGTIEDRVITVVPEYDPQAGFRTCGLEPCIDLEWVKGGPADQAGMTRNERVVTIDGKLMRSLEDFQSLILENRQGSLSVELESAQERRTIEVMPSVPEDRSGDLRMVGIRPIRNRVTGVRGSLRDTGFIQEGDELLDVVAIGDDPSKSLRRIRASEDFAEALRMAAATPRRLGLRIRRERATRVFRVPESLPPTAAADVALGVEDEGRSTRVQRIDGYPAALAGLPDDSQILRVDGKRVESWKELHKAIDSSTAAVHLEYLADGVPGELSVTPRVESRATDLGLLPSLAKTARSFAPLEATKVGMRYAVYMLKHVYLTLKKMLARDVSPRNLSGIITIAYVSRSLAESGIASLLFFLAVLSLNLAFVNLLPIPILDGGHLLFLMVEKIKGSPVSERVMSYSQMIGLVMVLALILYVTYNDLWRVLQN